MERGKMEGEKMEEGGWRREDGEGKMEHRERREGEEREGVEETGRRGERGGGERKLT